MDRFDELGDDLVSRGELGELEEDLVIWRELGWRTTWCSAVRLCELGDDKVSWGTIW